MSKIRKSAKGEDCTLRIPGVCNGNNETVVLCHCYPSGGQGKDKSFDGIADDLNAAYGCHECHAYIDSMSKDDPWRWRWWLAGVIRTHRRLKEKGLL